MYKTYGIHKKEWSKYKKLVINKSYDSVDLVKEFGLNQKQIWFLFTKLLQDKYSHKYLRANMEKEDIKVGQYVYCEELGNGAIDSVLGQGLMTVKFDSKELSVMCSQDGYTVYDEKKRKITKR